MKNSQNISITMPQTMLKSVEQLATKENRTLSELIREALRYYQRQREWDETVMLGRKRAQKLGIKPGDVEKLIHEYRSEHRKQR